MNVIETRNDVHVCADRVSDAIRRAVAARGRAKLLLSGGNSPKPVLAMLAQRDLGWSKVEVGLVDDRLDAHGSNAQMIRRFLLTDKAVSATLFPIIGGIYAHLLPADLCMLGMGTDGHTASWFPETPDLAIATDPNTEESVVEVSGKGAPGAGLFHERITLTLPAVMASREIILHIPGAKKREVFEKRDGLPVDLVTAHPNLTVICEPG